MDDSGPKEFIENSVIEIVKLDETQQTDQLTQGLLFKNIKSLHKKRSDN